MSSLQTTASRWSWRTGRIVADRSLQMTISIGTHAPVVVKLACGGLRGGAIERVAAALTNQHPLQQGRFNGAPGRMPFVLLQLLLRQGEGLVANQGRNRNLDPILCAVVRGWRYHGSPVRGVSATVG